MSKKLKKVYEYKEIFGFLTKLKDNNNKLWFDENREEYQACRLLWIDFAGKLLAELSDWENDFLLQDPRKCIYRINRDIRFSKVKTPYKTNFGTYAVPQGKNSDNAGYYVHLEPGNSFVAAGRYGPSPEGLLKIRKLIESDGESFRKIIDKPSLKKAFGEMQGDALKRAPKGFDINHPHIDLLRHKSFIFWTKIPDDLYDEEDSIEQIKKLLKETRPFVEFLNRALKE